MNVEPIIDHLQPWLTARGFARVAHARVIAAQAESSELPQLHIYPWAEEAGANRYDNHVAQRINEQVALELVCPIDEIGQQRDVIFTRLLGAVLADSPYEMTHVSGSVIHLDASVITWRDIFQRGRDRRQQLEAMDA